MKGKGKGFGLGLGKMKELANAFQKAQQIQEDAKVLQQELEAMRIDGQDADGLVVVTMSGNQEPINVAVKPEALEGKTADQVSALVTDAVKDAYNKSTATMREKMEALTGDLGLPGM